MKTAQFHTFSGKSHRHQETRWGRLAVWGFLLGICLGIILFAPAQWLATVISQQTESRVQLINTNGTIWQGSAQLVLTGGPQSRDQAQLPGHIFWHFEPSWTQLKVHILADCCMSRPSRIQLEWGWRHLKLVLENQQMRLPASLLSALGAPWNTLGLQADIDMSYQDLQIIIEPKVWSMQGQLTILISQASSKLSTIKPLGTYLVTIRGGSIPSLNLSTNEGSLILTGAGQWSGNRLRFRGEASATPEREQALGNLLNIIGRRAGSRSIITLG